jgi:hypothetical protein
MAGESSVSSTFDGSFGFTIYFAANGSTLVQDQKIPNNMVLGKMAGAFRTELYRPAEEVSGSGGVSYFIGGTYDPGTETISIEVNTTGMEATGKQTLPGDQAGGIPPAVAPLAVNWNSGRRSPMDDSYEDLPVESIMLEPPKLPAFHPSRSGDAHLLNSVPQTGRGRGHPMTIDLRNPSPQTVICTSEDSAPPGTRVTTWTFALVPIFNIERDDRSTEAVHSFLSTEEISFHVSIPGVTVGGSDWEGLLSWQVTGQSSNSDNGIPSQASETTSFSFRPNPPDRPTSGSSERNRPISYHVAAGIEGSTQHYFLVQDELDTLRQEYVDHGMPRVPARSELVACPIDGALNLGNYNFIEAGMQVALDRVTEEFKRLGGGSVSVSRGYLSPQRYRLAVGLPGSGRSFGRSLELVPQQADPAAWSLLSQACTNLGYSSACETETDTAVPCASPLVNHLQVTWPLVRTNETENLREVTKVPEGDS